MELGPEDVSLLERCPHFRGWYVQASMEFGPEDVSLLERFSFSLQVNRSLTHLGLAYTDIDTDCIIAMATVLHGNQTLRHVDLSRPLLHSRLEESTIHISRMLQVHN